MWTIVWLRRAYFSPADQDKFNLWFRRYGLNSMPPAINHKTLLVLDLIARTLDDTPNRLTQSTHIKYIYSFNQSHVTTDWWVKMSSHENPELINNDMEHSTHVLGHQVWYQSPDLRILAAAPKQLSTENLLRLAVIDNDRDMKETMTKDMKFSNNFTVRDHHKRRSSNVLDLLLPFHWKSGFLFKPHHYETQSWAKVRRTYRHRKRFLLAM